jgi:hypothetical protein
VLVRVLRHHLEEERVTTPRQEAQNVLRPFRHDPDRTVLRANMTSSLIAARLRVSELVRAGGATSKTASADSHIYLQLVAA